MPRFSWRCFHAGVPTFLNKLFLPGVVRLSGFMITSKGKINTVLNFLFVPQAPLELSYSKKTSLILTFNANSITTSPKLHFFPDFTARLI